MSQSTVYAARILNFSPSGLYLETDESLKSGTTIWLRVNHCLTGGTAADCPECLPSTAVADTKWRSDRVFLSPFPSGHCEEVI